MSETDIMAPGLVSAIKAKYNPNDEFYTPLELIDNEVYLYRAELLDSNIILPCDWDILDSDSVWAIKVVNHSDKLSYYTNLTDNEITESEFNQLLNKRVACNFLKYLIYNIEEFGIKSITASGYSYNKGISFTDIDYSNYNFCITNPPFSIFKYFIEKMIEVKSKDNSFNFLFIAPFLNRVSTSLGLHLMLKECYLGFHRKQRIHFIQPNGELYNKTVCVDWVTSIDRAQKLYNQTFSHTGIKYSEHKDDYPILERITMKDGTHPIRVEDINTIPDDYYGWMLCSIGVLNFLSEDEFEWGCTNYKKYYNKINPKASPFLHKVDNTMLSMGEGKKSGFHGIVLKRKQFSKAEV